MRVLGDGPGSLGTWWLVVAIGCASVGCDALLGLSDLSFQDEEQESGGRSSGGAGATNGGSGDTGGSSSGKGGTSIGGNDGGAGDGAGGGDGGTTNGGDSGARTGGAGGASGGKAGASTGGSAGNSAGTGGGSAGGGTGGMGGGPNCRGHAGPTPVNIEERFCIDRTEVTNAEYAAFLASGTPAPTTGLCAWNFNYTPNEGWPASDSSLPVVFVDFCDARGYCEWAGKRLCGVIGGGSFGYYDYPGNRLTTELYYACSNGGRLAFPYGNSYLPSACNTDDQDFAQISGSMDACEGGFPGLFDLSGNVSEWQDSCLATGGAGDSDLCRLGSYGFDHIGIGNPPGSHFSCGVDHYAFRGNGFEDNGIRCCSDAIP